MHMRVKRSIVLRASLVACRFREEVAMRYFIPLVVGLMLLSFVAAAREVAGVRLPDTVTLAPDQPALVLNGAGVRSKFFVKVYVGALYLPARAIDSTSIVRHTGPVAVHMHFLHSEVSKEKLVDAWNDGFGANLSDAERARLKERIDRFNALFRTARRGDVIRLEYLPGSGTTVIINNDKQGAIDGEDFMQAWLRIWLGEKPADGDLKRAMLGGD
jgi:hypothetical protein